MPLSFYVVDSTSSCCTVKQKQRTTRRPFRLSIPDREDLHLRQLIASSFFVFKQNTAARTATMPIDHTSMAVVKDEYRQVVDFYVAALKPLGYELIMEPAPGMAGLGVKPRSDFWINTCDGAVAPAKTHVAFTAKGEPVFLPALVFSLQRCESKADARDKQTARRSTSSTRPRSRPGDRTTARRGCVPTTTPTTTAPSSSIRRATTPRWCATTDCLYLCECVARHIPRNGGGY